MYGERMRILRREQGLTLDDVSSELNITRSTLSGYERYYRKPPIEMITKIAAFFGVSSDYLLGLTDERDPQKVEYNVAEYLKKDNLNYGGKPLTDDELKPIRELLEVLVRDRLPEKKSEDLMNKEAIV